MRRWLLPAGLTAPVALAAWAAWPGSPPLPAPVAAAADPAAPAPALPETVAPGTVVEPNDHPGWSHLVLKSRPRIRADQRDKVNDLTARMAAWMVTVTLADVQKTDAGYALRAVGVGLGAKAKGKDTVITADTGAKFGAEIGLVSKTVLNKGYDRQGQSAVVSRGPTLWVVDTPVHFADGGKHRVVRYRHALLVDAKTGKLDTYIWRLGTDGFGDRPADAVLLGPEAVDDTELVVDAREINFLGIPSEAAFAVDRLPACGKPVTLPAELRKLAERDAYTPADAAALEAGLRKLPR
jgi:hypothetical protein